jgi:hypothetical protein
MGDGFAGIPVDMPVPADCLSCEDHSLIEVTVVQGGVTANVDPGDFYAPTEAFPPMP